MKPLRRQRVFAMMHALVLPKNKSLLARTFTRYGSGILLSKTLKELLSNKSTNPEMPMTKSKAVAKHSRAGDIYTRHMALLSAVSAHYAEPTSVIYKRLDYEGIIELPSLRTIERDLDYLADEYPIQISREGNKLLWRWEDSRTRDVALRMSPELALVLLVYRDRLGNELPATVNCKLTSCFKRAEVVIKGTRLESSWKTMTGLAGASG